jgi:hypothetical protein
MAKVTSRQDSVVVAPSAPQEVAPVKPKRTRKPRRKQYMVDGKVARRLESTPADFNPQTMRLTRGQFASMGAWYLHCAQQAQARADKYNALSVDAFAHPEKHGRQGRNAKLQSKIAALESALLAKGFTQEQIAALLEG